MVSDTSNKTLLIIFLQTGLWAAPQN